MTLDFKLHTEFGDHSVVENGTIIRNDSFLNIVLTNKVVFDESSHNVLGNKSK